MLLWIAAMDKSRHHNRALISAKTLSLMSALVLFIILRPGSLSEKKALLAYHCNKAGVQLKQLYAKLRAQRQRRIWMWGGGLRVGSLATLPDVFMAAGDQQSYDALIPDW